MSWWRARGVHGLMRPEAELEERLLRKGIRFLAAPNAEAMNLFNDQARAARVGGCFHLTC